MIGDTIPTQRPFIYLDTQSSGKVVRHTRQSSCRVAFKSGILSIGCIDITDGAAEYILAEYRKAFPKEDIEVVLQP